MGHQATSPGTIPWVYNKPLMASISVTFLAVMLGVAFLIAGTWKLPFFWVVFAVQAAIGLRALWVLDPDLISERLHPRGKDQDPSGRLIISFCALLQLVVAALDVGRFHFSDTVPTAMQVIAVLLLGFAYMGMVWAMWANAYFSSAIRLQPDRNQKVIDDGPYRWVRHPGYAFASLLFVTQGLALGSWASVIPALFIMVDLYHRTMLEERLLKDGLPGYNGYAERVRFRWFPGIW